MKVVKDEIIDDNGIKHKIIEYKKKEDDIERFTVERYDENGKVFGGIYYYFRNNNGKQEFLYEASYVYNDNIGEIMFPSGRE